jgi:hypothetical protein
MVNRTPIRVGYYVPYNGLYFGLDVMLMDFDVDMIPMYVDRCGTQHVSLYHSYRWYKNTTICRHAFYQIKFIASFDPRTQQTETRAIKTPEVNGKEH